VSITLVHTLVKSLVPLRRVALFLTVIEIEVPKNDSVNEFFNRNDRQSARCLSENDRTSTEVSMCRWGASLSSYDGASRRVHVA
jgi:hypothetical protein